MQIFVTLISSLYVFFLDYLSPSTRSLERAIIPPLIIFLIIMYCFFRFSWNKLLKYNEKWLFLFWGTSIIQLLVLATGGLHSPFLILIHLFMIGLCFLFTFSAGLFFLLITFILIFIDIVLHQHITTLFLQDPSIIVLQVVSLIAIIPIAYIITQKYHLKGMLTIMLKKQIEKDEAILESIQELIIVTDTNLHILSVNDAVERALLKTRAELLDMPLFTAIQL